MKLPGNQAASRWGGVTPNACVCAVIFGTASVGLPATAHAQLEDLEEEEERGEPCWRRWGPEPNAYDVPTNTRIWGLERQTTGRQGSIVHELWDADDAVVEVHEAFIQADAARVPVWTPSQPLRPNAEYWLVRRSATGDGDAGAEPTGVDADAGAAPPTVERLSIFITGDSADEVFDEQVWLSGLGWSERGIRDYEYSYVDTLEDERPAAVLAHLGERPDFDPVSFEGRVRWASLGGWLQTGNPPCNASWPRRLPEQMWLGHFDLAGNFSGWQEQPLDPFDSDGGDHGCALGRGRTRSAPVGLGWVFASWLLTWRIRRR